MGAIYEDSSSLLGSALTFTFFALGGDVLRPGDFFLEEEKVFGEKAAGIESAPGTVDFGGTALRAGDLFLSEEAFGEKTAGMGHVLELADFG